MQLTAIIYASQILDPESSYSKKQFVNSLMFIAQIN